MRENKIVNQVSEKESVATKATKSNSTKSIKSFLKFIAGYKVPVLVAVVFSLASAGLNLVGPDKLSDITNKIAAGMMGKIDIDSIRNTAIILAILYVSGFLLNYIQGFIMATVTQDATRSMRNKISSKINRLPLRYFDTNSVGDILSRITNDVDTVGQTMNQSLSSLVSSLALFLGSAVLMFTTNWIMAIAGILAAFVGIFLMTMVIGKSQKYFVDQQKVLGEIDGHIEEMYGGHAVVKAYNGEVMAGKKFHAANDRLYNNAWKSQFLSGIMMPLMMFVGNIAYVVVCITGSVLAVEGKISFGTIVAFMLYIRLFTQPLQNLAQAATSIQSMSAASERVFAFLEEEEMEPEEHKSEEIKNAKGLVEFKNIKFGYLKDKNIINDFSVKIGSGQKVAIVGPTGAGKTTLVNLLMRFYEVNQGRISIDGVDISNIKRENVHELFGMVLQDTWLFEGTIRENIVYGKQGITDQRLEEVCAAAGLSDFIAQEPKGYDTVLDDKVSLSAGQKQLITIARAMIEDAPLLILDEATSSVDTRTELKVQHAMDKLTEGRTSFVIAHRLSTIKNADMILVLKDGDIIESGNHEELLDKQGFYADLYNSQFEQVS